MTGLSSVRRAVTLMESAGSTTAGQRLAEIRRQRFRIYTGVTPWLNIDPIVGTRELSPNQSLDELLVQVFTRLPPAPTEHVLTGQSAWYDKEVVPQHKG